MQSPFPLLGHNFWWTRTCFSWEQKRYCTIVLMLQDGATYRLSWTKDLAKPFHGTGFEDVVGGIFCMWIVFFDSMARVLRQIVIVGIFVGQQ